MAHAEVEWLVGSVRAFSQGRHGDPFQFGATVKVIDKTTVELIAAKADMNEDIWRSLCDLFRDLGFKTIAFTRKNTGKDRRIEIDTTTYQRCEE